MDGPRAVAAQPRPLLLTHAGTHMLFKSPVYTQASGSIGGLTYAHAPSGMYTRARAIPVNPATAFQAHARAAMTSLVNRWTDTLTATQRTAWALWAANTPFTNKLGDSFNISGQNAYIGANQPRSNINSKLGSTFDLIDDAPTIYNRGSFTPPTPTFSEATGMSVAFENTDAWANEDGAGLVIYQGRPTNSARNFFKGPWRAIQANLGDSSTPPTSPAVSSAATLTAAGFTITAGQKCGIAAQVLRADGRYSTRVLSGLVLVGA